VPRARRFILPVLFLALPANATDYYVSPSGDDSAAGTEAAPFETVERGQMAASGGDTVFIRGGVYAFSGTSGTVGVAFSKSGSQNNRINYFAYPGEIPIFDLFMLTPQERVTGFDVTASWIHIRGLEVRGVQQEIVGDSWGVRVRGSNNVLEQLNVHHGEAPGIFIAGSGANNLILNCDSHHNYDPLEDGGNGDGFGCHSTGANNVIRGARGYWNSDDGYDFINAPGVCIVEGSWAFNNGYVPEMKNMPAGNGAGFKSGGFGSPPVIPSSGVPRHVIRFNVAFGNRSQGFYANHHPGGLDFLNNTAFGNATNYDMLVEGGTSTHVLRNNVAMSPGTAISRFTGGTNEFNTWNLSVTVSAADFVSIAEADALMPRQADGSLPASFARLVSSSDLIDEGTNVMFPFTGSAPDLGAYEFGATAGSGGMGAGGAGAGGMGSGGTAAGGMGAAGGGTAGSGTAATGAGGMGGGDPAGGRSGGGPTVGGAAGVGGGAGTMTGGSAGMGRGGTGALGMGGSAGAGASATTGGAGGSVGVGGTSTGGATTAGASAVGGSAGSAGDPTTEEAAGCGCRVPSGAASGSALSLVSLAALALFRRRRSRG
jgi:MYXO-CTERM domain-containing protein